MARAPKDAVVDSNDALDKIVAGTRADKQEHQGLDFKRQGRSREETISILAATAACFANAAGGKIVVGVKDDEPGIGALVGTDLEPAWVRQRIYQKTKPGLDVIVKEFIYRGTRLLEITVQEGLDVYLADGQAPKRRLEDTCVPMSTGELARLHEERRGTDWSDGESGRPIEDVDDAAELLLRSMLRTSPSNPRDVSGTALSDLLTLLALSTSSGTLTRAGELLLCRPKTGDQTELLVYQYRETAGGEVKAGRRWQTPLLVAFTETLSTIEARIGTTPVSLPNGQQLQIQDYPVAAVREAIANALTHGDHRDRQPVYVEHSPQLLDVRSPGPLVSGISPANILTHPPKPRFPKLAEAMRACGLAERWGQGIDRMYKEMIRSGRSVPIVEVAAGDQPETTVRFLGGPPNSRITKFISTLPVNEQDDTDTLLVVATLASRRTVNAKQLAGTIQRGPEAAQAVLMRLAQGSAQLLEPTPRTHGRKHPDYRLRSEAVAALGPALAYQSRPQADIDRKVRDHVREYGTINSAAVQRMLDVDVYAARDVLRKLVNRKILVRTSEQRRGIAVKYGPGARFPSTPRKSALATTSAVAPLFDSTNVEEGPVE